MPRASLGESERLVAAPREAAPQSGANPHTRWLAAIAFGVSVVAFGLYYSTLLPGLDLGDTAAFQDAGGSREASPRQGYPLYFAVGNLVVWAAGGEPAFGMNLASAICGALACGIVAWLAGWLTASRAAALFTGLLLASSYTFWSQAVIAEVYALHVLLLGASLMALVRWSSRPTLRGLATFLAVYALGFGNHLMMILLAPAAILCLVLTAGPRILVNGRVVGLAVLMAALGALQYAWNFLYLWSLPYPPESLAQALRIFWFDVTKADWRESLVLGVDEYGFSERGPMYLFDLRQQIGITGIVLSVVGLGTVAIGRPRLAAVLVTGYLTAVFFAITYNVGDVHVFLLPSHLFLILAAGCGAAGVMQLVQRVARSRAATVAVTLGLVAFPVWRTVDTYPAVDRSSDDRPLEAVTRLTSEIDPERTLLFADLNWQLQNGLDYHVRHRRPELNVMRAGSRVLTLPLLIDENREHGREIVLTRESKSLLEAAYGDLYVVQREPDAEVAPLAGPLKALAPGTPYVLAVLAPPSGMGLDPAEVHAAAAALTAGTTGDLPEDVYMVMAGLAGEAPVLVRGEARPFRADLRLADHSVTIRMDSWLTIDTMRRAGFGHVIVNRRHVLTLERGLSFVALDHRGRRMMRTYAGGLFAPEPRYRIPPLGGT